MIVYPSILMMLIIFNPWLYGYVWVKLIEYAFWRMLWMIPVLPVVGCAVVELAGMVKKEWLMYTLSIVFILIVSFKCDNIYIKEGVFTKANNGYKLPQECVNIGYVILENEDKPVSLVPMGLYSHIRQYSGDIKLVFGRDARGYILPITDEDILELEDFIWDGSGDVVRFVELADKKGVNIIVLEKDHEFENLEEYSYEMIYEEAGYMIYHKK
ncbi:MAG: hypothetical protein IJZ96_04145 [Lachnospiraceae bacterium]|nr:hypothetical protein [Lachnospiraceae bacterium]